MDPNSQNHSQDPHHAQNNVSTFTQHRYVKYILYLLIALQNNLLIYFQAQGYGGPGGQGPVDLGPCDEGAMCPPGPGPPFQNQ